MTKLVRYTPNHSLNLFDRFFEDFFVPNIGLDASARWNPATELSETEDTYLVEVELPGMAKKDVNISFENSVLTISGTREDTRNEEGRTFHHTERFYGTFSRVFTFPKGIDVNGIEAQFKNGILTVAVPKAEETKPRAIKIK